MCTALIFLQLIWHSCGGLSATHCEHFFLKFEPCVYITVLFTFRGKNVDILKHILTFRWHCQKYSTLGNFLKIFVCSAPVGRKLARIKTHICQIVRSHLNFMHKNILRTGRQQNKNENHPRPGGRQKSAKSEQSSIISSQINRGTANRGMDKFKKKRSAFDQISKLDKLQNF